MRLTPLISANYVVAGKKDGNASRRRLVIRDKVPHISSSNLNSEFNVWKGWLSTVSYVLQNIQSPRYLFTGGESYGTMYYCGMSVKSRPKSRNARHPPRNRAGACRGSARCSDARESPCRERRPTALEQAKAQLVGVRWPRTYSASVGARLGYS